MKKSMFSLFERFPIFTGNIAAVWEAARNSEDAAGQTVIYGGGFALVVADGHGVMGVFTTPAAIFSAIEAARTEDALVRAGLA